MSGSAEYPLAVLLELRARDRDDAARALAVSLDELGAAEAAQQRAIDASEQAVRALAQYRTVDGALGAAALNTRAAHREQLRARRDDHARAVDAAAERTARAAVRVEEARAALAAARAALRAVELHAEEHHATQRARALAREDDAVDDVSQALRHRNGRG